MARDRFEAPENGIGVQTTDLDLISRNAALAEDKVLAELIKLTPFGGAAVKAVLPYGQQVAGGELGFNVAVGAPSGSALVAKSGLSDATVRIRPFRAIVGSRIDPGTDDHEANWNDIRSALHVPDVEDEQYSEIQLAATAANHRWDLIWARVDVDVDGATVQRYVKSSLGVVSAQNLEPTKVCTVTLGVTAGTEAGSPTPPSLPSDSGDAYYIPLAKVKLVHPHTLVTAIDGRRIFEVAPVITLHSASCRPASMAPQAAGYANDTNNAGVRTRRYAPASMVGLESRFIQLGQLPVSDVILDNSIDWRRRFFRWTVYTGTSDNYGGPNPFINASGAYQEFGGSTSIHATDPPTIIHMEHTGSATTGARVLETGSTAVVEIYVDFTTGYLKCAVTGETLQANVFVWLDATAQFDMQQTTPAYG